MKSLRSIHRIIIFGLCTLSIISAQPNAKVDAQDTSTNTVHTIQGNETFLLGSSTIELVDHLGGQSYAVLYQDGLLYAGFGPELSVIDVTNPAYPVRLGFTILPGIVYDIDIESGYAFVAIGEQGMAIVDITNPYTPYLISSYDSPGDVRAISYESGYAFLAAGSQGLRIVNVVNLYTPTEVAYYYPSDEVKDVLAVGSIAYVAAFSAGMIILDVSNPASPAFIGIFDSPGEAQGVAIKGTNLYLADDYMGLRVINISNPYNPSEIGSLDNIGYTKYVSISGSYVYASDWYEGNLYKIDISNPKKPVIDQRVGGTGWSWRFIYNSSVISDFAFIAGEEFGIYIVDLASRSEIARYGGTDEVVDLGMDGNFLYATDERIHIIDISNPLEISRLNIIQYTPSTRIEAHNGYVFANILDVYPPRLLIFNVTDPYNPFLVTEYEINGRMFDCEFSDSLIYIGSELQWQGLQILDISNPAYPTSVGEWQQYSYILNLDIQGQYAYLVDDINQMRVIDISTPSNPYEVSNYAPTGYYATDVQVSGNYGYFSLDNSYYQTGGLHIFDISSPDSIQPVSTLITNEAYRLTLAGNLALLATSVGVQMIDVSNSAAPALVGYFEVPFPAVDILWKDGYIYTANGAGGIFVFRTIPSSVSGRVASANGLPVSGVQVTNGSNTTTTDSNGSYKFENLWPGGYTLTPSQIDFTFLPPSQTVTVPPDSFGYNFTILPAPVSVTLTPGSSALLSYLDPQGMLSQFEFPSDAVTTTVDIIITPQIGVYGTGLPFTGHAFDIEVLQDDQTRPDFKFNAPVKITIQYSDYDIHSIYDEDLLDLSWIVGPEWQSATLSCDPPSEIVRDVVNNIFTLPVCQPGGFQLVGPTFQTLLPLAVKK